MQQKIIILDFGSQTTQLIGRRVRELDTFSFKEYLSLKEIPVNAKTLYTTTGRATLVNAFVNFMQCGGFPKFLQDGSVSYLTSLYESIIYRDILTRNGLTNEKEMVFLQVLPKFLKLHLLLS